jgi:hypothetical protein
MTPKEKAQELVDKFYNTPHCGIEHQPNKRYCDCIEMNPFQAKQCALMAVDEIIKLDMLIDEDTYVMTPSYLQYWEQVKQEIQKL